MSSRGAELNQSPRLFRIKLSKQRASPAPPSSPRQFRLAPAASRRRRSRKKRIRRYARPIGVLARFWRIDFVGAIAALAMAFAPGVASADNTWIVNSTADTSDATPNNGVCADGSGFCSLRAAVEESRANAVTDTIHFDPSVFTGTDATSTITLGSAMTITTPIHVDGADGCGTTTAGGN